MDEKSEIKNEIKVESIDKSSDNNKNESSSKPNTEIDRVEFIRFLLSLTEKLDREKLELLSMTLCYELIKPAGICNLINASIDLDETSQKQTTHNQRFLKLSLVIAGLPKLCCSLERFFESICDQLIKILLNTIDDRKDNQTIKLINTLIITICCALYRRSKRLFNKKFLTVLYDCFFLKEEEEDNSISRQEVKIEATKEFNNELEAEFKRLTMGNANDDDKSTNENGLKPKCNNQLKIRLKIDETIKITLLLLMHHFEKKEILKYFKQYFYLKCVLYDVDCELNKNLDKLLNELLICIKSSQYLIDKTLFDENNLDEFDRYEIELDIERGLKTIKLKSPSEIAKIYSNEVELKKIDQITQSTIKLICFRPDSFKIDTFLLLLERYSQKRTINHQSSLLICSLIDTLMKSIITPDGLIKLINFPDKAIDFLNLTLQRLTLNYDNDIYELSTQNLTNSTRSEEDKQLENAIKEDSLNMCLQIIDFILKKQVSLKIIKYF